MHDARPCPLPFAVHGAFFIKVWCLTSLFHIFHWKICILWNYPSVFKEPLSSLSCHWLFTKLPNKKIVDIIIRVSFYYSPLSHTCACTVYRFGRQKFIEQGQIDEKQYIRELTSGDFWLTSVQCQWPTTATVEFSYKYRIIPYIIYRVLYTIFSLNINAPILFSRIRKLFSIHF